MIIVYISCLTGFAQRLLQDRIYYQQSLLNFKGPPSCAVDKVNVKCSI